MELALNNAEQAGVRAALLLANNANIRFGTEREEEKGERMKREKLRGERMQERN